jgi:hypothetical protein
MRARRTLLVGDLHAPFMHRDAPAFLSAVKRQTRPDEVVLMGDVADLHALSRFTRSPAGYSAGHELAAAREQLAPLFDLFPVAKVCWGNHDRRVYDRAEEAGIPADAVRPMREILKHPAGWRWRDEWTVGGVVCEHGTGFSGKDAHLKAAAANMQPTAIGHIHAHAGVGYVGNRRHLIWGFNVGCLIDHRSYAFAYSKRSPAKPIIGVGLVEDGVPRFLPMRLRMGGRWVGSL